MVEDMHNHFIEDGIYCLLRASKALRDRMDRDLFYDAAIYYAFGVEKLCKAVIHNINPVFLLETHNFENAAAVFYENRLIETAKKKLVKDANRNLIPFKATVLRAGRFSQAIEDNIGRFTELADIRGALAHRSCSELDMERSGEFLMRTFVPTVEMFARELEFDADECFESEDRRAWQKRMSDQLVAQENYGEYVKEILTRHLAIWQSRKDDTAAIQMARGATEARLKQIPPGGPYPTEGICPCCKQTAVLLYRFSEIYSRDEVATTGTYAVGLVCSYCGISLTGYRAVDHFKLNDQGCGPFEWTLKISDLIGDQNGSQAGDPA